MSQSTEDHDLEIEEAFENLKDAALAPYHFLTSKPAKRTYLTTLLIIATSILLFFVAALAYLSFYYAYIPSLGFSRLVHLQFPSHRDQFFINAPPYYGARDQVYDAPPYYGVVSHPYGVVSLIPDISNSQPYDVNIRLTLPRTPSNMAAGNFMLNVTLLGQEDTVIARSARTACLTYRSPAMELLNKIARLPFYALGWRTEAEILNVGVFEEVEFAKGWRSLPGKLRLEMQSDMRVQVYGVEVRFQTRFNGVRWLMYNHRTLAFTIFASTFWAVEMAFAIAAYLLVARIFTGRASPIADKALPKSKPNLQIQDDSDEFTMSDTSRTFPTFSKQPALRYSSPSLKIKQEEGLEMEEVPTAITSIEADDEDEEDDDFVFDHGVTAGMRSDSGLGTSMESTAGGSDSMRRRKMKGSAGRGGL